jgi:acyl carrier protein
VSAAPAAGAARPPRPDPFLAELLAWLNRRFAPGGCAIAADTPLFAGGLINSMRVLELIAWTEQAAGRRIPDAQVRMDNFGTAARIAALFGPGGDGVRR